MLRLRQLSATERIAATFGPACWLPRWIQFLRPVAMDRMEFSARLLLSSSSGYCRKHVLAHGNDLVLDFFQQGRGFLLTRGHDGRRNPSSHPQSWNDHVVRGAELSGRQDPVEDRDATHACRVAALFETIRQGNARRTPTASDRGQLRDPQTRESTELAEAASTHRTALHAHSKLMDESGRALVCIFDTGLRTGRKLASVRELIDAIAEFLAARNEQPKRYVWRAKGEDILRKIEKAGVALNRVIVN